MHVSAGLPHNSTVETSAKEVDACAVNQGGSDSGAIPEAVLEGQLEELRSAPIDPVEAALSDALSRAAAAGAWSAGEALARELGARRLTQGARSVVHLATYRQRKS